MCTVRGWCTLALALLAVPQLLLLLPSATGNRTAAAAPSRKRTSACYMRYQQANMPNKSIDFENPSVFELLASNYTRERSPLFALLHQWRDCIVLSYWINNEPMSRGFRGYLKFACGVHELLHINLMHWRASSDADDFCLSMLHGDRPLEQFGCPTLALTQAVPITLQAHVGSMVVLSQETPAGVDYLLFQRVTRYQDMLSTLRYFELRYNIAPGVLQPRYHYTTLHWVRCDCDALVESLGKLYQCLGISRKRPGVPVGFGARSVSDDMLVMAAIGIGGGVTFFLLLKIRLIC